jgi:hypothetical protein
MVENVRDDMLVSRQAGLLEAEVDGELIGLHIDNGTCYGFNPTATRIWALIEQPMTVGALIGQLASEYEVDADLCRADVTALLAELQADGLVALSPAK